MDLDQLTLFMFQKKQEFEEAVSERARDLTFQDLTAEIDKRYPTIYKDNFKEGQTIDFHLCQGHYQVSINKDELVLQGSHGIVITRFLGEKVEDYYQSLSERILKAKDEYPAHF